MNFRVEKEIRVEYNIDSDLLNTMVPKLFVQPLIENIFIHAFPEDDQNDNYFKFSIQEENEKCIVSIPYIRHN